MHKFTREDEKGDKEVFVLESVRFQLSDWDYDDMMDTMASNGLRTDFPSGNSNSTGVEIFHQIKRLRNPYLDSTDDHEVIVKTPIPGMALHYVSTDFLLKLPMLSYPELDADLP